MAGAFGMGKTGGGLLQIPFRCVALRGRGHSLHAQPMQRTQCNATNSRSRSSTWEAAPPALRREFALERFAEQFGELATLAVREQGGHVLVDEPVVRRQR